jgi:tripartite-type tricarboxylate transporter receptor subunit TctC
MIDARIDKALARLVSLQESDHLCGELFKMLADVNMIHVPYRGTAPAMTDLLGGQVQMIFGTIPASIEHIKDGKLRPLAVTTARRLLALPNIPAVGEFLPGYEGIGFVGLGAPKNTPPEIVDMLNVEINAGLASSGIKARIADMGAIVHSGSSTDFGKFIAEQTEKWAKVIRAAHITAQ